ncbi:MAG TPA: succinate dehydrogenase cytochrome b subunit [Bacteroidia bacterium]|jgi:succinate dehydrogenase / fumarate reductase cytochrome b subunit|nr:succinate dehydrogenase cytochrome b subunit [Bacteroidia bacterium]
MTTFKQQLTSSVGKKVVMAATGLFLCVFLLEHLYGNILLYFNDGGKAFDEYSHDAVRNILIRIIEIVLFAAIIIHVVQALIITNDNRKARPIKYAVPTSHEGSSWFSRNMGLTGSVVLFFIVIHLYHYFFPYRILHNTNGHTISQMVKIGFQDPVYVAIYVIGVTFLFFHLNHAFRSAFHTLGLNNKKYTPVWQMAGSAFAWIMWIAFASFPILFYFGIAGKSIVI